MAGAPIWWFSRKESVVALSSCEAEYIALVMLAQEVIFIKMMLKELDIYIGTVPIYIDSQSAQDLAEEAKYRKGSRHIDIKNHWIRDAIDKADFYLIDIDTELNVADLFTKALSVAKFKRFRSQLLSLVAQSQEGKPKENKPK